MVDNYCNKNWITWVSFVVSVLLQVMPWPDSIQAFRPNWALLTLLHWLLTTSHPVSISISFIIGIVLDLINASTLGVHALAMSIVSYLVLLKNRLFRKLPLLQQALLVAVLSVIVDLVVFLAGHLLISGSTFQAKIYWNSIVNGALWPWFFLMMNKMHRKSFI